MPLPSGTSKTTADLITQADTTWKTNGGTSTTKTIGTTVRQFFADMFASFWSRKDTYVAIKTGNTLTFDQEAIHAGAGAVGITSSTITLSYTGAKSGTVVRFYSQTSGSAPTLDFGSAIATVNQTLEAYSTASGTVNVYTFVVFQRGSDWIVEYSRYVATVTVL